MSRAGAFAQELNSGSAAVILSMGISLGTKSVNVSNCDICDVLTSATGAENRVGAVKEVQGP